MTVTYGRIRVWILVTGLNLVAGAVFAQDNFTVSTGLKVITVKDQISAAGPAENFTGKVQVTRLVQGAAPSNITYGSVQFEPGARSNWHTHPKGQLLVVTEGTGRVQEWGKSVRKIKVGDVVWTPANVKHWHGAGPDTGMVHGAVTETLEGKAVEWMEKVSEKDYLREAQ